MSRLGKLLIVIAVVQGSFMVSGAHAPASAERSPDITIRLSDPTVRLGTEVTVSGRAPHPLRPVVLQMRTSENGWQDVARTLAGLDRTYRFTAPSWYGAHRLRVVAPQTLLARQAVSARRTLRVTMSYSPKGARSDWSWLFAPGVRWDPCQTVTYRINPHGGYARSVKDIRAAFRDVGRASGFDFQYVGRTAGKVTRGQHGYHPLGTDVIVDWQTPREERGLAGRTAGIGGHWVQDGRRFDGYILLDRTERLSRRMWRQVVVHEIGHVLGLGHARSRTQVMNSTSSSRNVRWGAGDLAGIRRLGPSRGCLTAHRRQAGSAPREAMRRVNAHTSVPSTTDFDQVQVWN